MYAEADILRLPLEAGGNMSRQRRRCAGEHAREASCAGENIALVGINVPVSAAVDDRRCRNSTPNLAAKSACGNLPCQNQAWSHRLTAGRRPSVNLMPGGRSQAACNINSGSAIANFGLK